MSWQIVGIPNDIDGEAAQDQSGYSVSLSSDGSIVAIGSRSNDGNGEDSGHVRIFRNIKGKWEQIGNDIDGEAEGDMSGSSISLSSDGSIVAIASINNDGLDENGWEAYSNGHVRVYQNVDNLWTRIGDDIDGKRTSDKLGSSISLSSDGLSLIHI